MSLRPAVGDRLELRGLRVVGAHGALPEEHGRAQPFELDLDLEADMTAAGASDDLAQTIDYGEVAAATVAAMEAGHADLLEHLAQRVLDAVFAVAGPRATQATVRVRKLRPPVPFDLDSAAVVLTRNRP